MFFFRLHPIDRDWNATSLNANLLSKEKNTSTSTSTFRSLKELGRTFLDTKPLPGGTFKLHLNFSPPDPFQSISFFKILFLLFYIILTCLQLFIILGIFSLNRNTHSQSQAFSNINSSLYSIQLSSKLVKL